MSKILELLKDIREYCSSQNNCTLCDVKKWCEKYSVENKPFRWKLSDITRIPIITTEEYIILKNMTSFLKNRYLVRDKDGGLQLFCIKPIKSESDYMWTGECSSTTLFHYTHLFKSIKWEDDEPRLIVDYIQAYEEYYEDIE